MDSAALVVLLIVAVAVVFAVFWYLRRKSLRKRFGPEYDRAVTAADRLVTDLVARRGYLMADFERRAEDLSITPTSSTITAKRTTLS